VPALPFVVTNNPLAPAPSTSFNDRYPVLSPQLNAPFDLDQPESQSDGSTQAAPKSRRLSSRFDMPNRNDAGPASASTPGIPIGAKRLAATQRPTIARQSRSAKSLRSA
jgi:hypothetical protein